MTTSEYKSGRRLANGPDDELGDLDLSDKQRRFVDAYIVEPNATKAALKAGYSAKTVNQMASSIRWTPKVVEAIARRIRRAEEAADIKAAEILTELKTLGLSNLGDYFESDEQGWPKLRNWGDLTRAQTAALKEVTIDTEIKRSTSNPDIQIERTTITLKMHDKVKPLHLLMRYLRLLDDGREGGLTQNLVIFEGTASAAAPTFARALLRGSDY